MRRTRTRTAILLAAALALGGCPAGDEDSGGTPAAESSPTPSAEVTPPTKAKLRSALLTLRDMPAGWTRGDYDPRSKDNLCPAEVAGPLGLDKEPMSVGAQYLVDAVQGPSFAEAIQVVPAGRGRDLMPIVADA